MASSTPEIDWQALRRLAPINQHTENGLHTLLGKAVVETLAPGKKCFSRDLTGWLVYVLKGQIHLGAESTIAESIHSSQAQEIPPLFDPDNIRQYGTVVEQTRIVRFDRRLHEALLLREQEEACQVTDIQVSEAEMDLFGDIFQACANGRIPLPGMPEVARRLTMLADDPDVSIQQVAGIVQLDPALATRLMHMANSALYGPGQPASGVNEAITRLGLKKTCEVGTALAMGSVFKAPSAVVAARVRELWLHSVEVSALAHTLAMHCGAFNADHALLLGLIHDIGALPILQYAAQEGLADQHGTLAAALTRLQGTVGALIMQSWELKGDYVTTVEQAENWNRDSGQEADYCDVIILAQLLAPSTRLDGAALPDPATTAVFRKLAPYDPDSGSPELFLASAEAHTAKLRAILTH